MQIVFIKNIRQLKGDIRSFWCKNFSLIKGLQPLPLDPPLSSVPQSLHANQRNGIDNFEEMQTGKN